MNQRSKKSRKALAFLLFVAVTEARTLGPERSENSPVDCF